MRTRSKTRPLDAALSVAACVFALAVCAAADPIGVVRLRWNGSRAEPVLIGRSAGDDRTVVSLRPATRKDPIGYRNRFAFYRLATALGSAMVPPTEVRAMPLRELLGLLDADRAARSTLPGDLSVLNDGTVMVLITRFSARARPVSLGPSGDADLFYAWAEGRRPVPASARPLVAAFVEMLMLDYLAGNLSRDSFLIDAAGSRLVLADNALAFAEIPDNGSLDRTLASLRRVTAFPRSLVARLRAFDEAQAEVVLRSTPQTPIASRPVAQMMDRRKAILSLVDARAALSGESAALSLP